jgi:hypothetical protein
MPYFLEGAQLDKTCKRGPLAPQAEPLTNRRRARPTETVKNAVI